jgi:predicted DCC family thiol-disulfide oxidoreductase YuxK
MAAVMERRSQRGELALTVLYDERCELCRRLRDWLGRQPTLNDIEFLAADSPEAHARYPELDHARATKILTVVTSDGRVYEAERAWLVCGWTLPSWRPTAEHLSTRARRPLVRLGGHVLDAYRHRSMCGDECRGA